MTDRITDLTSLKSLSKQLDDELSVVFEKYGLKIEHRRARIGGGQLDYNFKLSYGTEEERTQAEAEKWKTFASLRGISSDLFGETLRFGSGDVMKVTGCDFSKLKNAIKLERVRDGKKFRCSVEHLKWAVRLAS